jgi:hypothetical protein
VAYAIALKIWIQELQSIIESPWPSSPEKKKDLEQAIHQMNALKSSDPSGV